MKGAVKMYTTTFVLMIILPYILTMFINGNNRDRGNTIKQLSTGRDVIMHDGNNNYLIDVEEYIAGVLPGMVEPNCEDEFLEAQAVAVRTRIYFAMGEETVVDSKMLGLTYYDDDYFIRRWGQKNYKQIKARYEKAVINTAGKLEGKASSQK